MHICKPTEGRASRPNPDLFTVLQVKYDSVVEAAKEMGWRLVRGRRDSGKREASAPPCMRGWCPPFA